MRTIIEQLPKAIRWSNIVMWFFGVITALLIIGTFVALVNKPGVGVVFIFITLLIGIQFWMIRNYKNACQVALESEYPVDIEAACKAQVTLVKFYGILTLILAILIIIGVAAAISMPAYMDFLQRAGR